MCRSDRSRHGFRSVISLKLPFVNNSWVCICIPCRGIGYLLRVFNELKEKCICTFIYISHIVSGSVHRKTFNICFTLVQFKHSGSLTARKINLSAYSPPIALQLK